MKKVIYHLCLLCFFVIADSCKSTQMPMDDVTCLRNINTKVSKELKKEIGQKYDSIKEDIKLIMKFYVKENGQPDSIIFVKSNLLELGVNEDLVIDKLMQNRYECIWNVYYTEKIKPDDVTIIFNPKLSKLQH